VVINMTIRLVGETIVWLGSAGDGPIFVNYPVRTAMVFQVWRLPSARFWYEVAVVSLQARVEQQGVCTMSYLTINVLCR